MQLATGFAKICLGYLPTVEEGVSRSNAKISFGTKVSMWRNEDGSIQGSLTSTPPKIPCAPRPKIDFVLQFDGDSQLELIFEGTPRELNSRIRQKRLYEGKEPYE